MSQSIEPLLLPERAESSIATEVVAGAVGYFNAHLNDEITLTIGHNGWLQHSLEKKYKNNNTAELAEFLGKLLIAVNLRKITYASLIDSLKDAQLIDVQLKLYAETEPLRTHLENEDKIIADLKSAYLQLETSPLSPVKGTPVARYLSEAMGAERSVFRINHFIKAMKAIIAESGNESLSEHDLYSRLKDSANEWEILQDVITVIVSNIPKTVPAPDLTSEANFTIEPKTFAAAKNLFGRNNSAQTATIGSATQPSATPAPTPASPFQAGATTKAALPTTKNITDGNRLQAGATPAPNAASPFQAVVPKAVLPTKREEPTPPAEILSGALREPKAPVIPKLEPKQPEPMTRVRTSRGSRMSGATKGLLGVVALLVVGVYYKWNSASKNGIFGSNDDKPAETSAVQPFKSPPTDLEKNAAELAAKKAEKEAQAAAALEAKTNAQKELIALFKLPKNADGSLDLTSICLQRNESSGWYINRNAAGNYTQGSSSVTLAGRNDLIILTQAALDALNNPVPEITKIKAKQTAKKEAPSCQYTGIINQLLNGSQENLATRTASLATLINTARQKLPATQEEQLALEAKGIKDADLQALMETRQFPENVTAVFDGAIKTLSQQAMEQLNADAIISCMEAECNLHPEKQKNFKAELISLGAAVGAVNYHTHEKLKDAQNCLGKIITAVASLGTYTEEEVKPLIEATENLERQKAKLEQTLTPQKIAR